VKGVSATEVLIIARYNDAVAQVFPSLADRDSRDSILWLPSYSNSTRGAVWWEITRTRCTVDGNESASRCSRSLDVLSVKAGHLILLPHCKCSSEIGIQCLLLLLLLTASY